MQNVLVVIFEEDSKAFQALSELKTRLGKSKVLQAGIIKNVEGSIVVRDGFSWNTDIGSSWITGGLIGGLVGIIGGPFGMLLGASLGMMIGNLVGINKLADDQIEKVGIIHEVVDEMQNNYLALVSIVDEEDEAELTNFFGHYNAVKIIRRDVKSVQAEISQAEEAEKELRKQAKAKMREEKKTEWHDKAEEVHKEIEEEFDKLRHHEKENK